MSDYGLLPEHMRLLTALVKDYLSDKNHSSLFSVVSVPDEEAYSEFKAIFRWSDDRPFKFEEVLRPRYFAKLEECGLIDKRSNVDFEINTKGIEAVMSNLKQPQGGSQPSSEKRTNIPEWLLVSAACLYILWFIWQPGIAPIAEIIGLLISGAALIWVIRKNILQPTIWFWLTTLVFGALLGALIVIRPLCGSEKTNAGFCCMIIQGKDCSGNQTDLEGPKCPTPGPISCSTSVAASTSSPNSVQVTNTPVVSPTSEPTVVPTLDLAAIFVQAATHGARMYQDAEVSDELVKFIPDIKAPNCDGNPYGKALRIDYSFGGRDQWGAVVIDWEHNTSEPKTYDASRTKYLSLSAEEWPNDEKFHIEVWSGLRTEPAKIPYRKSEVDQRLYFYIGADNVTQGSLRAIKIVLDSQSLLDEKKPLTGTLCIDDIEFTDDFLVTYTPIPTITPSPTATYTPTATHTPMPFTNTPTIPPEQ